MTIKLNDYLELLKGETRVENELINAEDISPEAKIYYSAIQGARQNEVKITNAEIEEIFNFTHEEIREYKEELNAAGWGDPIEDSKI